LTLKAPARYFALEAGRAYEYFSKKLRRGLVTDETRDELTECIDDMLSVIYSLEHDLYEYRGGKAYPRNVLLNKREWLETFEV
jgi:hypothetical protein